MELAQAVCRLASPRGSSTPSHHGESTQQLPGSPSTAPCWDIFITCQPHPPPLALQAPCPQTHHCWGKGVTPCLSSSQLIPVPPGSQLKVQSPDPSLPCQARSTSAFPAAGRAALFPVEVPAKQDESDTPVGVWHSSGLPSYIGKPQPHRATGWGQHSHPIADAAKVGRGCGTGTSRGCVGTKIQGAAAGVALVTAQGTAARGVAKGNGLNRDHSGAVIRWGRRK